MTEPITDIVVAVHEALDDTAHCLDALERETTIPHRVIVVNDGSGPETTRYLRARADEGRIELIDWRENRGYTAAVNAGLAVSRAPYAVLLNSDTIVTAGWLEGMIRGIESDPRLGAVGPLSNAASFQSVPMLRHPDDGFAVNAVTDPANVAATVRTVAERTYPRVPFLNGFCLMLRREAREAVGPFDVYTFPDGYGEENDYAIRLREEGFELAVIDDVYVFHRKSRSFGHERRRALSRLGHASLIAKYGRERVERDVAAIEGHAGVRRVRRRMQVALSPPSDSPRRVLFLLPVRGGAGGAHSVLQEASEMRALGVDVHVAVRQADLRHYRQTYRGSPRLLDIVTPFRDERALAHLAAEHDVVVATVYSSVRILQSILEVAPHVLPAYYVQDYEPFFFREGSAKHHEALTSYSRVPYAVLFAKTDWIAGMVSRAHGVPVFRVSASVDHELYRPDPRRAASPLVITAMVRPNTPRRAAERTMRVLARAARRFGARVRVEIFGPKRFARSYLALPRDFPFVMRGILRREEVATQLRRSHVFVDLSDYQAFGRTGIEAMASGCAVINPVHGGAHEYCVDRENSLLVDTRSEDACYAALEQLIEDDELRNHITARGLERAAQYTIRRAAESELAVFAAGWRAMHDAVLDGRPLPSPPANLAEIGDDELARFIARNP